MSEFDPASFEAELRALKPYEPPRQLISDTLKRVRPPGAEKKGWFAWKEHTGWLMPIAGMALIAGIVIIIQPEPRAANTNQEASSASAPVKADEVELSRQLVASYDAIARLPDGEPIRFRCAQWLDKLSLRDTPDCLSIERTIPRLEIVPIGFETY